MRIIVLGVSAFFLSRCITARSDDAAVKMEIQTAFEAIVRAMPAGDGSATAKAAAKEFLYTDIVGRSGPAGQWADRSKTLLSAVKSPAVSALVASVTVKGDSALAVLKAKVTGTGLNRLGSEGPLDMTITYRTDWVRDAGAWKVKSAREVMFEGKVNKRPLNLSRSAADEEVRKQFQPLYGAVTDLYEKQNWEAMEKGIPDGFIVHDAEGTLLSKKELLDRIKAGAKVVSNPIVTMEPQQVALDGDKVVVIRVMKLFGDVKLPDGKTGRLTYINVARDTFAKAEKGWNPKSSDELYAEAAVNGFPVPLSAVSGR